MLVVKETTDWGDTAPNHVYFLNNQKNTMYAYINAVTGLSQIFKNPIQISNKGRTFEVLRKVSWND